MDKSSNRLTELSERNIARIKKADQYTTDKPVDEKIRAGVHTRVANTTDTVVTALGSKTLAAVTGGAWGAVKGVFAGTVVGAGAAFLFSGLLAAPFLVGMGATMLFKGIKGAYNGYFNKEANYSGNKGQAVGDKIAAAGNAQHSPQKRKIREKSLEKAVKEIETIQEKEVRADAAVEEGKKESYYHRDMVASSRSQGQLVR